MMLTLKHELMHVWLYEHGHTNQDGKEVFGYEDVCELTALSNDFINKIVKEYTLRSSWYKLMMYLKKRVPNGTLYSSYLYASFRYSIASAFDLTGTLPQGGSAEPI